MTRDDEEPVVTDEGLWPGEVTGLRLGEFPDKGCGGMGGVFIG